MLFSIYRYSVLSGGMAIDNFDAIREYGGFNPGMEHLWGCLHSDFIIEVGIYKVLQCKSPTFHH